jgi:probable HAF family extracellular repeat protein
MVDLGVLPGDKTSRACGINDAGQVVGSSLGAPGIVHAFIWSKKDGMQDLGSLPPGPYAAIARATPPGRYTEALGINNSGEVVGSSRTAMGGRAFVWTKETGMLDLNSLISANLNVVLATALRIADDGRIVCMGGIHNDMPENSHEMDSEQHAGPLHAFLLAPINNSRAHL